MLGAPFSESVGISLGIGAGQIVVVVANPDPEAYPAVMHVDTTIDADVSAFELGFKKDALFVAFLDNATNKQLSSCFQAPLDVAYKGASVAARLTSGGDTTGTRVVIDGEFIR